MNREIKKIAELRIDIEDIELEGFGIDVVSFVNQPAIEVGWQAFNQAMYVDNKDYMHFKEFLDANQDIMKKPFTGANTGGIDHKEQLKKLEAAGIDVGYPFGYCFQIAQFLFYALGGYESEWDLKCIKKMSFEVEGVEFEATHWYVEHQETGQIVDLSAEQFDGILDIKEWYPSGVRANLGFPYYNVNEKRVEFEETVPSLQTLKLYNKWKEEHGELEGIEKYYQAAKYEEVRMSEEFVTPNAGEDESEFIGRCMTALEGEFPDQDQRLAVCYNYWESDKFLDENPCQSGWIAYGLKEKDGRMVPNCIPIENAKILFESYTDYPEAVKSNAERGIRLNEEQGNKCATQVGKVRAQQLAKGEPITFETVKRMYSYLSRAEEYYDPSDTEACGTISYLLWGGEEALRWSEHKIRHVEEMVILEWAEEHGEEQDDKFIEVDISNKFNTIADIAKAVVGLDILGKLGIRKDQEGVTKYKYTGPNAERGFCKALMRLNKLYSSEDMEKLKRKLSIVNPGMGPGGRNSYDVFAYKGGVNCRHYWTKNLLFKPDGSQRVLMLNQGPADGNAGKSNNDDAPSPTGAVSNNASLKFSVQDDEKRIVAGPMMIPNKFIIRKDSNGEPYYVYFTKETIRKLQEKWSREHKWNATDVNHDGNVTDQNVLLEQWIVETPNNDKSRDYYGFYDLPQGTWFGVYKVNDDQTWSDIKSGKLTGFSIEGNFVEKAKEREEDLKLKQIIDILNNVNK